MSNNKNYRNVIHLIKKYKDNILILCLILAVLYAVFGLYQDINNVEQYMMNDFRSRVVAARLLDNHTDPYFFKWSPNDPETYLDPRDFPERPVSRVTVPPTVLIINKLILIYSYTTQKIIWLILQWTALLLCLCFASKRLKNKYNKFILWIVGLVLIAGSWFWRFHVDAGQLYIFYLMLLFACYLMLSRNNNGDSFTAGLIIGYTASLRFNTILFCLPFVVTKKVKLLSGTVIGFLANVSISLIIWGISPWLNYFKALHIHEMIHTGLLRTNTLTNSIFYNIKEVEGVTHFDFVPRFLYSDSSFQGLLKCNASILIIIFMIILIIYLLFLFKYRNNLTSLELTVLTGITTVIVSEFFIPATRYSYYDVIWLYPLSLLLIILDKNTHRYNIINFAIVACAIAVLSFGETYPYLAVIGPLFLLYLTTWLSISLVTRNKNFTD